MADVITNCHMLSQPQKSMCIRM